MGSFVIQHTCSWQGILTGVDSMPLAQGCDDLCVLASFSPWDSGVLLGLL